MSSELTRIINTSLDVLAGVYAVTMAFLVVAWPDETCNRDEWTTLLVSMAVSAARFARLVSFSQKPMAVFLVVDAALLIVLMAFEPGSDCPERAPVFHNGLSFYAMACVFRLLATILMACVTRLS